MAGVVELVAEPAGLALTRGRSGSGNNLVRERSNG